MLVEWVIYQGKRQCTRVLDGVLKDLMTCRKSIQCIESFVNVSDVWLICQDLTKLF